jgi:predicted glycoside hydrolase/deacetylase ChbG (UPF0249 family)
MVAEKFLTVISDDFGLCPAVNEGIVECFTKGVLTDVNVMTPCNHWREAVKLAKHYGIPIGLHAVFTCDWDVFKWKPLTPMKTMVDANGYFKESVQDAWATADLNEAATELSAQYETLAAEGLPLTHIAEHMGVDADGKFAGLMAQFSLEQNTPHRLGWSGRSDVKAYKHVFDAQIRISGHSQEYAKRKVRLKEKLSTLPSGHTLWITHAATDDPALDHFCTPNHPAAPYARIFRVLDYKLMLDAEVKTWLKELNIRLTPLKDVPTTIA